jgi:ribosomal protein S18 acetylase RimI-like enzyme
MFQSSITSWLTKNSAAAGNQNGTQAIQTPSQSAASNTSRGQKSDESREQPSTAVRTLSKAKLLPNVGIVPVTEDNVSQFRRLVTVLLPATYTDKFYAETLNDPVISSVSRLALWKDEAGQDGRVVAGIRCRVFVSSPAETPKRKKGTPDEPSLYISTIGTLAPFRNHGLATILLREVMWRAIQDYGISTVTAHVWEANEEARAWYAKLGFQEAKYEADYYRKLRPSGAWLLQRRVLPSDFVNFSEGLQ